MSAPAPKLDSEESRRHFLSWLEPTTVEEDYEVSEIEGEIPRELGGTLFRNGPSLCCAVRPLCFSSVIPSSIF